MAKKRVRATKQTQAGDNTNAQVKTLLVATVALLSALLILNVVSLTGFAVNHRDSSQDYLGFDSCTNIGGISLREETGANHNGQRVTLRSTSENVIVVDVDGEAKAIKVGHENWIQGVSIKNFASNDNDACLILN